MWRQRERMAGMSAHPAYVQQQHVSAWVKCHQVTASVQYTSRQWWKLISTLTQVLFLSTILRYLYSYFHFLLLSAFDPIHLRGKYCTFYSTTIIWQLKQLEDFLLNKCLLVTIYCQMMQHNGDWAYGPLMKALVFAVLRPGFWHRLSWKNHKWRTVRLLTRLLTTPTRFPTHLCVRRHTVFSGLW